MTSFFPMFMKLAGRHCLVVGAGHVGEPKIAGLIDTGARIHVVAIEASSQVHEWAEAGKIELAAPPVCTERSRRQISCRSGHGEPEPERIYL